MQSFSLSVGSIYTYVCPPRREPCSPSPSSRGAPELLFSGHPSRSRFQSSRSSTRVERRAVEKIAEQISVEHLFRGHIELNDAAVLVAKSSMSGGRGLFAVNKVEEGDVLVRIPRHAMMTFETARSSTYCGTCIDKAGLQQWQALCLHLVTERAAGHDSRWCEYIQTLPDMSDHPLMWSEKEIESLKGSPMLSRLRVRLQNIEDDVRELIDSGANDISVGGKTGLVTIESVRWAAAVLLSRGFYLALEDEFDEGSAGMDPTMPPDRYGPGTVDVGSVLEDSLEGDAEDYLGSWEGEPQHVVALVPWADMLNHSSEATEMSVLTFEQETGTAVLRAHRAYSPGDEVFDSYGPWKSRSDLLLDYGFVDEANGNAWVEVPLASLACPRGSSARAFFAAAGGMLEELGAVLDAESAPDSSILSWIRAAVATDEELASLGWEESGDLADRLSSALTLIGNLEQPVSVENEGRLLESLTTSLEGLLAGYEGTLEEDVAELEGLKEAGRSSVTRASVLRALIGEKMALQNTLEVVSQVRSRIGSMRLDNLWDFE